MPRFELDRILRPELAELKAYTTHPGNYPVRLDANEPPPFLSAHARQRISEVAAETPWGRYPDATAAELRGVIAEHVGVSADEILVGMGGDEIIGILLAACSRAPSVNNPPSVLTATPTFVMYRLNARSRGFRMVEVPLDQNWDLPVESFQRAIEIATPNVIFIATPNNPSSNLQSFDRIEAIIQAAPESLVVIDEAYIDFAAQNQLSLYRKYENVAVLRTISKLGFAGLRLGWLIGRPELIREVDKVRAPYNMSILTHQLGSVIFREIWPEVQAMKTHILAERERVAQALSAFPGVHVTPSDANFLWVKVDKPAEHVFEQLRARGVVVRSFHQQGGRMRNQLRITIGTSEENAALLSACAEVL